MGRRKINKRYKQKYNFRVTLQDSASDEINLVSSYKTMDPTGASSSSIQDTIKNPNDFQDRTPEFIMQESKKVDYYDDMSPKINMRLPKFKLNLDIPENDGTDDVTIQNDKQNNELGKDLEKTLSVEKVFDSEDEETTQSTVKESDFAKCFSMSVKTDSDLPDVPRKELTLNEYFQIPSSTFNIKPAFNEANSSNFVFISESSQNNSLNSNRNNLNICKVSSNERLPSKTCQCHLKVDKQSCENVFKEQCCILIEQKEKFNSSHTKPTAHLDKTWDATPEKNVACVDLPVISDLDSRTTNGSDSRITVLSNLSEVQNLSGPLKKYELFFKNLKCSFTKVTTFCSWLAGKFIIWIKKGYRGVRKLISIAIRTPHPSPLLESELSQVIAVVKFENEQIISVLSDKISSLSQELIQVRVSNEANLLLLTKEVNKIQTSNVELIKYNENLTKELKSLNDKVSEIMSSESRVVKVGPPPPPPLPVTVMPGASSVKNASAPVPPPPPPPPPSTFFSSKPAITVTPSNANGNKTPKRKNVNPANSRPAITVEDLLKVTLKKAPQNFKENRRNTVPGPRGPVISMDMLRNVKLKSARRRSLDHHKSPRGPRLIRNRSQTNLSLSPIMMGAEGSLSRLLKPSDANRRLFKKIQPASSTSESDLSKSVMPNKLSVSHCRSESILA